MADLLVETPLWALVLIAGLASAVAVGGAVLAVRHPHETWRFVRGRFALDTRFGLGLTAALLAVGGLFWAFTEVLESWTEKTDLYPLDDAARNLALSIASPTMTTVMKAITLMGAQGAYVVMALLAGWLAYARRGRALLAFGLVVGPGEGLVYALKVFFARVRPADQLVHAGGYSFPSGHSFTAAALYGFAIYLLWSRDVERPFMGRSARVVLTAALVFLIALVGVSRIYLSVHYFTDVMGGFVLAAGWLLAVLTLMRVLRQPPPDEAAR